MIGKIIFFIVLLALTGKYATTHPAAQTAGYVTGVAIILTAVVRIWGYLTRLKQPAAPKPWEKGHENTSRTMSG
jgi:hypothetical protein